MGCCSSYPESSIHVDSKGSWMSQDFVIVFGMHSTMYASDIQQATLKYMSSWRDDVFQEPHGLVYRIFFETDDTFLRMYMHLEPVPESFFLPNNLTLFAHYAPSDVLLVQREVLVNKFRDTRFLDLVCGKISALTINTMTPKGFNIAYEKTTKKQLHFYRNGRWQTSL